MIFAVLMLGAFGAATWIIWAYVGFWSALGFFGVMVLIYKAFTWESGPQRPLRREELNAFQASLSDD